MMNEKPPTYIFGRDHRSAARLNLLHGLYVRLSGYLLHPSVPRPAGTAAVADIGTGTAIWPIQLTDELPESVKIDGFDIATSLYPNKVFWPPNVCLYEQDCFSPFPPEFHGKYDVLSIRFLVTLVNKSNLKPLIRNLSTLLKPGGYIQWAEPDNTMCKPIAPPGVECPGITRMCNVIKKPTPDAETDWVHTLASTLAAEGFTSVSTAHHPVTPKMRPFFGQINLLTTEDKRAESATHAGELEDIASIVAKLKAEFDSGVAIDWAFLCITAQKSQ